MKKILPVLCAICMVIGVFGSVNVTAFAADTKAGDYLTVINVTDAPYNANGADKKADPGIVKAIMDASKLSNPKKKPILIKIPAGTYYLDSGLLIFSNIHLQLAKNATLVRKNTNSEMLLAAHYGSYGLCMGAGCTHGGYTQIQNVVIEGGTWDGNIKKNSSSDYYSLFKFMHGSGITIRNTNLKNCLGLHMIVMDGVKDVTIENVSFSNQYFYTGSDSSYYQGLPQNPSSYSAKDWYQLAEGQEAVHFDYTNSTGADSSYPMDNTMCSNLAVKNCSFSNVLCGLGSHHVVPGLSMKNVEISGNTFKDVKGYAIQGAQMKGMTVKGNTVSGTGEFAILNECDASFSKNKVSNAGYGIYASGSSLTVTEDNYSVNDRFGLDYPAVWAKDSSSLAMKNTTINGAPSGGVIVSNLSACNLDNVTANSGVGKDAVYLYYDSNGTVKNCKLSSAASGVHVYNCKTSKDIVIQGNTIENCGKHGIELWDCNKITMTSNQATGTVGEMDIYIGQTSNSVCTGNTVSTDVSKNIVEYLGSNNTIRDNYTAFVWNGWSRLGNQWYYYINGVRQKGWLQVSGSWYFFKADGAMAASEWCGGYWLNADGTWTYQPKGSWKQDAKGWKFVDTSGWFARNETIKIDGTFYTFDANGYWAVKKAANPMKVSKTSYSFKRSALTKTKTIQIKTSNAQGKVTYKLSSAAKKAGFKVTSKGKVAIPKKCRKGTYKIQVTAAGNQNYKPGSRIVTIKIK